MLSESVPAASCGRAHSKGRLGSDRGGVAGRSWLQYVSGPSPLTVHQSNSRNASGLQSYNGGGLGTVHCEIKPLREPQAKGQRSLPVDPSNQPGLFWQVSTLGSLVDAMLSAGAQLCSHLSDGLGFDIFGSRHRRQCPFTPNIVGRCVPKHRFLPLSQDSSSLERAHRLHTCMCASLHIASLRSPTPTTPPSCNLPHARITYARTLPLA